MSSSARELLSHSWDFLSAFARLPESWKLLLNDIMRHCYTDCSDNIEAANVVTLQLNVFLQQLVDVIHGELQANPSSDLQTSSDSWYLLRTLVEGINYHFNFRPAVIVTSADSDLQSAAAACRGIKQCVAQFIELLSTDESREENIAAFTIFLMDSEQDAEISVRFALLRAISRRVIAVKRPGQSWGATIDGASVRFDEDCGLSGVGAAVAPVLQCASTAAAAAACGCGALVEALKIAEEDGTRRNVAGAILEVAWSEEGRAGVVAAGGCGALVEALKIAEVRGIL